MDIERLANDIAELIKDRLSESEPEKDTDKIPYADAVNALNEIKEAVNIIRPDLETVVDIKNILDKYDIEPLNQFYFIERAEMDAVTLREKNKVFK